MKITKIVLGFSSKSAAEILKKGTEVYTRISNNTYFPSPTPTMHDLLLANNALADAITQAASGDKTSIVRKSNARKALEDTIRQISLYVTYCANGSREILSTSGFDLNSETRNQRILGAVKSFNVIVGVVSGQVTLSAKAKNARSFNFNYKPANGNGDWQYVSDTVNSKSISGLIAGQTYSFKIIVNGTSGQTSSTEVITKMVA